MSEDFNYPFDKKIKQNYEDPLKRFMEEPLEPLNTREDSADPGYDEWRRRIARLSDESIASNVSGIRAAESDWARAMTDEAKERGIPWEPATTS